METSEFIDTSGYKGISNPKELVYFTLKLMAQNLFQGNPEPILQEGQKQQIIKSQDKRETFILSCDFLVSLLQPYYDSEMKTKQKEFDSMMQAEEKNLIAACIRNEALRIATKFCAGKDIQGGYLYWKNYLTNEKVVLIEKTSKNFEVYISGKYQLYTNLFRELNFLLYRIKWLIVSDYAEYKEDKEEE